MFALNPMWVCRGIRVVFECLSRTLLLVAHGRVHFTGVFRNQSSSWQPTTIVARSDVEAIAVRFGGHRYERNKKLRT